jgi:hypothetical protein
MDASSLPPNQRPAPSLAELRAQLTAARDAYPALRCELSAALVSVRRALGETVPTRAERRGLRE